MGRKPVLSCEDLVARHLDALHGLALAWTHDRDQAGELVQRTFLKAFEKVSQLRSAEAARSWLIAILRNERNTDLREQARLEAFEEEHAAPPEEREEGLDPALLHALPSALDCLPAGHRDVLLLRYQQELSYEAIGESLGIPTGTVMSRLHRAKAQLRRLLLAVSAPTGGAP